jgi:hypothetical protein
LDGPKNATTLPFRPSFEPEAYAAGVIVGERLADLLREAPSDIVPTLTFWLNAGKALEHLFPEAEGDIVNPFIRGAQSSFPSDLLPAVVVTVPRLSVLRSPATAHPPTNTQSTDDLSTDDQTTTAKAPTDEPGGVRAQIADLLEQAADRIRAGQSTGILRTSGLQPGGTFDVHAPEQETR